jgi:hypothetical protein
MAGTRKEITFGNVNIAFLVAFPLEYYGFRNFEQLNNDEQQKFRTDFENLVYSNLKRYLQLVPDSDTRQLFYSGDQNVPSFILNRQQRPPEIVCFENFESFHRFMTHTTGIFRMKMDEFSLETKNTTKIGNRILIRTFLSVFPALDAGILMFNLSLDNPGVNDIIMIKQIFSASQLWTVDWENSVILNAGSSKDYGTQKKPHDFREYSPPLLDFFARAYIRELNRWLDVPASDDMCLNATLIEITDVQNRSPDPFSFDAFLTDYSQELYGMLTSDEGWRYVPPDMTKQVIGKENQKDKIWTTREFLRVLAKGTCVLSITSDAGGNYSEYRRSQEAFFTRYGQKAPSYFSENQCASHLAGLNHGIIFVVENVLLENMHLIKSEKFTMTEPKTIRESLGQRREYIKIIDRIPRMRIPEISQLYTLIRESFAITARVDELDKKRKILDTTLEFQYKEMIDVIGRILAIIGAFLALKDVWTLTSVEKAFILLCITLFFLLLPRIYLQLKKFFLWLRKNFLR